MHFFAIASVFFTAALGVFASPVVERQAPQSVAVVLGQLTDTLTPLTNQLLFANTGNATQEVLYPVVGDITNAVNGAVVNLNLLIGQPAEVVLASVDGTTILATSDIATIISEVLSLVFTAINAVLLVVDVAIYGLVYSLLYSLAEVLFSLLSVVLGLVSALVSPLVGLLSPILGVVGTLGLTSSLEGILGVTTL